MKLSDFLYELPAERIARYPARPRDASRLMLLAPGGPPAHHRFRDLPSLLSRGDLLVLNDTRVHKVRLLGSTAGGGEAEVFLLGPCAAGGWEALVRPGRRLRAGRSVAFGGGRAIHILEELGSGRRRVEAAGTTMEALVRRHGRVPLPPYIDREAERADEARYQTVFAREGFSVAAPTAGLHFTPRVFAGLRARGVEVARIRLDVGTGTFKPVTSEEVEHHRMDSESYRVGRDAALRVNAALESGRRIVAVGTTATRCLEDQVHRFGRLVPGAYETSMYIYPGYRFRAVSGLVTNFHLPGSSLILLVSALAGRERVLGAYAEALDAAYRFYSYGDAMLVWGH
jgi:S-adenosylmethionine:tRNA ribosyltransferase-isomerase